MGGGRVSAGSPDDADVEDVGSVEDVLGVMDGVDTVAELNGADEMDVVGVDDTLLVSVGSSLSRQAKPSKT